MQFIFYFLTTYLYFYLFFSSLFIFSLSSPSNPPNRHNPLSPESINKTVVPLLFKHCVRAAKADAKAFTGYAMRVGGTSHIQNMGVDPKVRRDLGEWSSKAMARHYLAILPVDQFGFISKATF